MYKLKFECFHNPMMTEVKSKLRDWIAPDRVRIDIHSYVKVYLCWQKYLQKCTRFPVIMISCSCFQWRSQNFGSGGAVGKCWLKSLIKTEILYKKGKIPFGLLLYNLRGRVVSSQFYHRTGNWNIIAVSWNIIAFLKLDFYHRIYTIQLWL